MSRTEEVAAPRVGVVGLAYAGYNLGEVTALEADGLKSSRYYLAARRLAERHRLDALSLHCFPHLKSQICLGVAKLNDDGIAAACEGDLHSSASPAAARGTIGAARKGISGGRWGCCASGRG